jgi:arylsulfatase A-like enzyme
MAAGALPLTPEQVARIRGNYYGKISLVDHWIGRILDALAERGWSEDTLVVFWSDHGEMAGDHAHLFKSVLYESAVRVPLILRWPGRAVAGQTSAALAEIIDVFPTLLEALELPPSRRCLGRSLLPLLQDPAAPHREASFSEAVTYGKEHITMVRTPTHKYVVDEHSRGCHLYDLQADPGERRNLVGHPGYREIEGELRERVLAFLLSAQVRR